MSEENQKRMRAQIADLSVENQKLQRQINIIKKMVNTISKNATILEKLRVNQNNMVDTVNKNSTDIKDLNSELDDVIMYASISNKNLAAYETMRKDKKTSISFKL